MREKSIMTGVRQLQKQQELIQNATPAQIIKPHEQVNQIPDATCQAWIHSDANITPIFVP